jgi:hypothetical protein
MSQVIRYSTLHAPEPVVLKPGPGRKYSVVVDERSTPERLTGWLRRSSGKTYRIGRKVRRPLFEPLDVFWGLVIAAFIICVWG